MYVTKIYVMRILKKYLRLIYLLKTFHEKFYLLCKKYLFHIFFLL